MTVTGARTLLADLEGTCAWLSPGLIDAQIARDSHLDSPQPSRLGRGGQTSSHESISQVTVPFVRTSPAAARVSWCHVPLTGSLPTWPSIIKPHAEPLRGGESGAVGCLVQSALPQGVRGLWPCLYGRDPVFSWGSGIHGELLFRGGCGLTPVQVSFEL